MIDALSKQGVVLLLLYIVVYTRILNSTSNRMYHTILLLLLFVMCRNSDGLLCCCTTDRRYRSTRRSYTKTKHGVETHSRELMTLGDEKIKHVAGTGNQEYCVRTDSTCHGGSAVRRACINNIDAGCWRCCWWCVPMVVVVVVVVAVLVVMCICMIPVAAVVPTKLFFVLLGWHVWMSLLLCVAVSNRGDRSTQKQHAAAGGQLPPSNPIAPATPATQLLRSPSWRCTARGAAAL